MYVMFRNWMNIIYKNNKVNKMTSKQRMNQSSVYRYHGYVHEYRAMINERTHIFNLNKVKNKKTLILYPEMGVFELQIKINELQERDKETF